MPASQCKRRLPTRIRPLQNLKGESGMMIIVSSMFFPRSEESSHETYVQCMLCYFKYSNQFLAQRKLRSHLQKKRGIHHKSCANSKIPSIDQS